MGIPHLTRHTLPFSESVFLTGDRDGALYVRSVVIDGPSLVYHVYSRLLSWMVQSVSPFDAQPTCNEVSVGVMLYLLQLTILGVKISNIFFDGALPEAKREARLHRLEKSRLKHELFCIRNKNSLEPPENLVNGRSAIDPEKVLLARSVPTKYKYLPENPFMVPAVFEDLKCRWNKENIAKEANAILCSSLPNLNDFPWADITVMVPREADVDCAHMCRVKGCAVLTNDSDLLLHDLGLYGSVLFLDSVVMHRWDPCKPTEAEITASRLTPAALSRRLGLADVRRFAYELRQNPGLGLTALVRRSKDPLRTCNATSDYLRFLEEYRPFVGPHAMNEESTTWQSPQCLDARVCEIFSQCEYNDVDSPPGVPHMYLPILNDDPARRCAWVAGRGYRTLGYSILNMSRQVTRRSSFVHEYVRRGQRIVVDRITLVSEEQITIEMRALSQRLTLVQAMIDDCPSPECWTMFALSEIYSLEPDRARLPKPEQLTRFLRLGYMGKKLDWTDIHLLAQSQAVLYSLRILKQLIGVAFQAKDVANEVEGALAGLPPLRVLMRSRREIPQELLNDASVDHLVGAFYQMCERRFPMEVPQSEEVDKYCPEINQGEGMASCGKTRRDQVQGWPFVGESMQRANCNVYELLCHKW